MREKLLIYNDRMKCSVKCNVRRSEVVSREVRFRDENGVEILIDSEHASQMEGRI